MTDEINKLISNLETMARFNITALMNADISSDNQETSESMLFMKAATAIKSLQARIKELEDLVQFAITWIEIEVAIKEGKYHDQPELEEDIQKLLMMVICQQVTIN